MITHDPRRRIVLRGMFAAGFVLGVPTISGCRADAPPEAAASPPRAPVATASSAVSAVMAKLSKEEAHYQDAPQGEQNCSNCLHFVAESNTCKVVAGEVSPDGWCMLWARQS